MSRLRLSAVGMLCVWGVALSAVSADAAYIDGRFSQTLGTVVVSLGQIDFTPLSPGSGISSGAFTVDPNAGTRSGSFLSLVFNALPSDGTIGDLSGVVGDGNYLDITRPVSRSNYITLAEQPL